MLSPLPISGGEESMMKGGAKRRGVPVKTLKKLLKKAGLKTSGKKATLTRRAKKARLMKGGIGEGNEEGNNANTGSTDPPVSTDPTSSTSSTDPTSSEKGGRKRRKSRGKFF